jgi:hypothetical protein
MRAVYVHQGRETLGAGLAVIGGCLWHTFDSHGDAIDPVDPDGAGVVAHVTCSGDPDVVTWFDYRQ